MFDRQACWEGAVKNCIINGDKEGGEVAVVEVGKKKKNCTSKKNLKKNNE